MTKFAKQLESFSKGLDDCHPVNGSNADTIKQIIEDLKKHPLTKRYNCIGSGGSSITADFAVYAIKCSGYAEAHCLTPLEFLYQRTPVFDNIDEIQNWLFTESGRNPDIRMALEWSLHQTKIHETEDTKPPIVTKSLAFDGVDSDYSTRHNTRDAGIFTLAPTHAGKSYIAAESVVTACAVLNLASHGYYKPDQTSLEVEWHRMNSYFEYAETEAKSYRQALESFSEISNVIVLYDPVMRPAARVLETCLMEQAVVPVQMTDYRNFCHGRHSWLKRHTDTTLVIPIRRSGDRLMQAIHDNVIKSAKANGVGILDPGEYRNVTLSVWQAVVDAFHMSHAIAEFFNVDLTKANTVDNADQFYYHPGLADGFSNLKDDWTTERLPASS